MSISNISFGTPTCPKFQWFDSLAGLTNEELDELIILCRSASAAFHSELSDRCKPGKDRTLENCQYMLLTNAERINESGLTHRNDVHMNNLHTFLADPSGPERAGVRVARQFLWVISKVTEWSYALLVLCTLGKNRLERLDEHQRVKLVKFIKQHRDLLFCPQLKDRAARCNLHQIHMKMYPPLARGQKRKRSGTEEGPSVGIPLEMRFPGQDTKDQSDGEDRRRRSTLSSIAYVLDEPVGL